MKPCDGWPGHSSSTWYSGTSFSRAFFPDACRSEEDAAPLRPARPAQRALLPGHFEGRPNRELERRRLALRRRLGGRRHLVHWLWRRRLVRCRLGGRRHLVHWLFGAAFVLTHTFSSFPATMPVPPAGTAYVFAMTGRALPVDLQEVAHWLLDVDDAEPVAVLAPLAAERPQVLHEALAISADYAHQMARLHHPSQRAPVATPASVSSTPAAASASTPPPAPAAASASTPPPAEPETSGAFWLAAAAAQVLPPIPVMAAQRRAGSIRSSQPSDHTFPASNPPTPSSPSEAMAAQRRAGSIRPSQPSDHTFPASIPPSSPSEAADDDDDDDGPVWL